MMRALRSDESAVATVIGAVLVAAVVFAGVAAYRLNHVPVQVAQAEADAMSNTVDSLLRITQAIDQGGNASAVGTPLRLTRDRASILEPPSLPHSVAFEPASAGGSGGEISLSAPSILVVERDGIPRLPKTESWTAFNATTISGVGTISSFRLKLDSVSRHNDNDNVTLVITANGSLLARAVVNVTYDSEPGNYDIRLRVTDLNGTSVYDQGTAYHITRTLSPYWLDLLTPEYRLGAMLASAPRPIGITMTTADNPSKTGQQAALVANHAISSSPADGSVSYLNVGELAADPHASSGGGRLVYHADLMGHVPQTFTIEHGAIIVSQSDGSAFRSPPDLRAAREGANVILHMGMPTLTGAPSSVTGGVASVRVLLGTQQSFVGLAPNVTLDVPTSFPSLWAAHLRETLARDAGLTEGSHFQLQETSTSVRLVLEGTDASTSTRDVVVRHRAITVQLDLQA